MTIKALSEELGVSKTAITKTIDKLGLRSRLQKEGNRYIVPDFVADQIRLHFAGEGESDQPANNREPAGDPDRDMIIELLRAEIDEKNQQIRELHLILQQNQLLLAKAQGQDQEPEDQPAEVVEAEDHTVEDQEQPQKGFWQRFFGL